MRDVVDARDSARTLELEHSLLEEPLATSRLDDRHPLRLGQVAGLERTLNLVFPLVDPARRRDDQLFGASFADSLNELASLDADEAGQRLGECARYLGEVDALKSVTVRL